MQLKVVSKEEAHRYIDTAPGSKVMILTYNTKLGISDHGVFVKKRKSKKMTDLADTIVLCDNDPIIMLNLHGVKISKDDIVKSIMLASI